MKTLSTFSLQMVHFLGEHYNEKNENYFVHLQNYYENIANVLIKKGYRNIILYGGGKFSRKLIILGRKYLSRLGMLVIADDKITEQHKLIWGIKCVYPSKIKLSEWDAVFIASDYYEEELYKEAKRWAGDKTILRIKELEEMK